MGQRTQRAILDIMSHAKKRGVKLSYYDAFKLLSDEVHGFSVRPFRNWEKPRVRILPAEYYERNAAVALTRYLLSFSQRMSFVGEFGFHGERGYALVRDLSLKDAKAGRVADQAFRTFAGLVEVDPQYNFKTRTKRFLDDMVSLEVATKIASGFAPTLNLSQSFISTISELGYWRFFKGFYNSQKDINTKGLLRQSGVDLYSPQEMLVGIARDPSASWAAKLADVATKVSGFKYLNKFNNVLAASAAEVAIRDWHKAAQGTGRAARVAQYKLLSKFGVDYEKPLQPSNIKAGMVKFARSSQLQKDVMKDPLMFNDPRIRPFAVFKRFGYRQAAYIKDMLKEELALGNVVAPLRLAASGFLGGYFISRAISLMKSAMSGEKVYVEDDDWWEEFVDAFSSVGALGVVGDVIASENKVGAMRFFAEPVFLSDMRNIFDATEKLTKDVETFGFGAGALQRYVSRVGKIFGTIPKQLLVRQEPKGFKERKMSQRKGRMRSEALDLIAAGKSDVAVKKIKQWNYHHPEDRLTWEDINMSEVIKRQRQKKKLRANP